jgi:uncharacterized protein YbbC (DUF1343 family)
MYPDKFEFHEKYFDKIMGTAKVREAVLKDIAVKDIVAGFQDSLKTFYEQRQPCLLY